MRSCVRDHFYRQLISSHLISSTRVKMDSVLSHSEDELRPAEAQQEVQEENEEQEHFPQSYRSNSPAERHLLDISQNFQHQFLYLYPERRPLLLTPPNECGVQKFVCTTLRPSPPREAELLYWNNCASFVADFLSLEPLDPPEELPRLLRSPSSVLRRQSASCLEFSVLLCSLLLGADYDAYCVSGHAVQEICARDQSQQDCPLLEPVVESVPSDQKKTASKYTVALQPELHSRYLRQQEEKRQEAEAAPDPSTVPLSQDQYQKPVDPLHGVRVHCWVLVLSGSRGIKENFFIDPLTGVSYPTDHQNFLGIESVWNNFNYYVNVQDCKHGCRDMLFDLEDGRFWEPVLSGAISKKDLILEAQQKEQTWSKVSSEEEKEQEEEEEEEERRVLYLPTSWASFIHVTEEELQRRFPGGKKEILYKNAKLERFAPNVRSDGLITRLSVFKEPQSTEVYMVKTWYQNRSDHLQQRLINITEQSTIEHFKEGRPLPLLTYSYRALTSGWERRVEFSGRFRFDKLVQRVMTSDQMMETFEGRRDFLYHRHVFFSPHVQFSERSDDNAELQDRPVQRVVELFHRNVSKPAHEDVNERMFELSGRCIELKYHCNEQRLIPPRTKFFKPRESTEQQKAEQFTSDMVSCFQVDVCQQPPKIGHLYKMLKGLIIEEQQLLQQISMSQKEMRELVSLRQKEDQEIENSAHPLGCSETQNKTQGNFSEQTEDSRLEAATQNSTLQSST